MKLKLKLKLLAAYLLITPWIVWVLYYILPEFVFVIYCLLIAFSYFAAGVAAFVCVMELIEENQG